MEKFSFIEMAKSLDTGVSFEGKAQNWGTAEEVKPLIDEIDKCTSMIYLNLDGNTLGVNAAAKIGEALKKHPEFKKALWSNIFTGRLKSEIPNALKHLGNGMIAAGTCLTVFNCSDNALGPNGMLGLVDLLSSPTCYSLQELRLNNCGLGIGGGKMLSKALLKCHADGCKAGRPLQLKIFIAGRNRLENEGAKALAEVFAAIKTLEEVAMPQNGIYHEGIAALANAFRLNENMRVLDLNDNTIKPKGSVALARVLHCMPKLREIHFAEALVKTKGAITLADAFQDNHVDLEVLNLGYNEIASDGGYAILTALENKTKLKSVLLNGNQLGVKCCEQLKELIQRIGGEQVLGSFSEDESEDNDEENDLDETEELDGTDKDDDDDEEEDISENYAASDDENYNTEIYDEDAEDVNYVTALNEKTLETSVHQSLNSSSGVHFVGEIMRPKTVETFCTTPNPSIEMFNSLQETNLVDAFRDHLKRYKDSDYLVALVFTTLKCAALALDSKEALDLSVSLFEDAFDYAESTRQVSRVKNFFLIQLGLLKCEDKNFKPVYNLQACRYALRTTISKKTLAEDLQNTFNLFLERFP